MTTVAATTWLEQAACRGRPTSIWFSASPLDQAVAITICSTCPGREPCLAEALALEDDAAEVYGVRGGLRPAERRGIAAGLVTH
jgi:Transcription factor WhiB